MAVKILVLLAVLKLAASRVSGPDPEVDISISQSVDSDSGSFDEKINTMHSSKLRARDYPKRRRCVFGGTTYTNNVVMKQACMELKCTGGKWFYTGTITAGCKNCTVSDNPYYEPLPPGNVTVNQSKLTVKPYVTHNVTTITTQPNNIHIQSSNGNYIPQEAGRYAITQQWFKNIPAFGVYADFNNKNCTTGLCISKVQYHELGIKLSLTPRSYSDQTEVDEADENDVDGGINFHPICKLMVDGNEEILPIGVPANVLYSATGTVLVFKSNPTDPHRDCINIVGSRGFSVRICSDTTHFTHLDVWAMPILSGKVYGLCDTITKTDPEYYVARDRSEQDYSTIFAPTWKIQ